MTNLLLINNNITDYQKIVDACNDNTHSIVYNQSSDTYDTLFQKYQTLIEGQNIQIKHLAIVSHNNGEPNFSFLDNETVTYKEKESISMARYAVMRSRAPAISIAPTVEKSNKP